MNVPHKIPISSLATLLSTAMLRPLCALALFAPPVLLADDSSASAIAIQPGDTAGAISTVGDEDWFKFTIDSAQMVTITTKAGGVGVPALNFGFELYDSSGSTRHIASGTALGSIYGITKFLQPGTYYFRVYSPFSFTGAYRVVLKTQSSALPLNQVVRGNLDVPNDWENYKFAIKSPGYVELWARKPAVSTPAINLTMILRDEAGNQLKSDVGSATRFSGLLNPGNYFVTITSYSNGANTGDFDLKLITPDNALAITEGITSGTIDVPHDKDHFRFVVPGSTPKPIRFRTSGSVFLQPSLQNEIGQLLKIPGSRGSSKEDDFEMELDPGVYFFYLYGTNSTGVGSFGNYTLTLSGLLPTAPEISIQQPARSELVDSKSKRSFGKAVVGVKKGITKAFVIRNTGNAPLTGIRVAKGGRNKRDFQITLPPASSVAPGKQTTFEITFQPKSKGSKNAWLRVASNDANENPFDISIIGMAVGK